jgi:hypothetical protein
LQTIGRVTGETAEFILQQMAALYARGQAVNDRARQALLDAIGLLTLRECGDRTNVEEQIAYLQQVYGENTIGGAGAMTVALATLCEHLIADLAKERGVTPGEVLQELAARYVGG